MVYNTLNKLKWTKKLDGCEIIILHRGAKDNKKKIFGNEITEIKKSYFCYRHGNKEIFIPLHRVLEVRVEGKVLWKRKKR